MRFFILAVSLALMGVSCGGSREVVTGEEIRLEDRPYLIEMGEKQAEGNGWYRSAYIDETPVYTERFSRDGIRTSISFSYGGFALTSFYLDEAGNCSHVQHSSPYQVSVENGKESKWPERVDITLPPKAGPFVPSLAVIILDRGHYRPLSKKELLTEFEQLLDRYKKGS